MITGGKAIVEVKVADAPNKRLAISNIELDSHNNLNLELANEAGLVVYAAGHWLGFTLTKDGNDSTK